MDGDDGIEVHKIVFNVGRAVPADYIDSMLALGWSPYLVIDENGAASLCERHPDKGPLAAVEEGRRVSSWWRATKERRAAIEQAMRSRGLVYHR